MSHGCIKFYCDYLIFDPIVINSVIDKAALPLWWFYVRKFCIIFPTRYILHDCIYICVGIIWHLHIFADKIHFWHSVKTNRQMIVQMTMSKYLRKLLFFQFKILVTSSKIAVLVQNILTCANVDSKQKWNIMYFQFTFQAANN